jgi:Zn-dependent metalloprotease
MGPRANAAPSRSGESKRTFSLVDAHSGAVFQAADVLETGKPGGGGTVTKTAAVGSGRSLYVGTVAIDTAALSTGGFEMRDLSGARPSSYVINMGTRQMGGSILTDADNAWGNGTNSDAASAGVDAHDGAAETLDYYKLVHGRTGIDNAGNGGFSRVHDGRGYANAFWSDSCFCMTYGDGSGSVLPLVSLDIAGHEMSHGVTSRESNLTYSGESGGLNEALSDIFGSSVEDFSANAADASDWLIGEKIFTNGGYIRDMSTRPPTAAPSTSTRATSRVSTCTTRAASRTRPST